MNINHILVSWHTDELFGPTYGIKAARQDSDTAQLAFHNSRHIIKKSPHCRTCTSNMLWFKRPHIIIQDNDPLEDCLFCEGGGIYYHSALERYECPCKHLGRPATAHDIIATVNAQTL